MRSHQIHLMARQIGIPIVELTAEKVAEVQASPQAQLKTARYKKAVYLGGELVFKGPYKAHETALINNMRFNYAMGLLENALELCELERGSLPWEFLGYAGDDQYYLAASNVGMRRSIPFEVVNSRIERNVKVVKRGDAVERVSDREGTERLTEDIKLAALQHLYLRFLLDIGDSGTHNVLIREDYSASGRLIAGIDLEETRSFKVKERKLDCLFKKPPSKRQVQLYWAEVHEIRSFSDVQFNPETSAMLEGVGVDLTRLTENMARWRQLSYAEFGRIEDRRYCVKV
jgi:hypothetical protein